MAEFATIRSARKFADFTAQVTVSEQHADTVRPTEHPVERGAQITDHAIKEPARLTLTVGWSNSGAESAAQGDDFVRQVYARLLALQAAREPFSVSTGKRAYTNMLVTSLTTDTDETTENALICIVGLQEVIIVQTQAVIVPPRDVQKSPQETADTTVAGTKQAIPAKSANIQSLKDLAGLPNLKASDVFEIPMTPTPQSFGINIGNQALNMAVKWAESKAGGWVMDVADQAGRAITNGIPLVTGANLFAGMEYLGLKGVLAVQTDHDTDALPTFDNLGLTSHLFYVPG